MRRTTEQQRGGIIELRRGESIYSFSLVQQPAYEMTTDTVTTHFDYHSIDHNLLKLDILGHDDPTMIRTLEDLTGIDAKKIPLDDPQVMSLFRIRTRWASSRRITAERSWGLWVSRRLVRNTPCRC